MNAAGLMRELRAASDPAKAAVLLRFFKTGKGEYAEGDKFLGLTAPVARAIALKYAGLPHGEILKLLRSPVHEARSCALAIMVRRFERGEDGERRLIYDAYLANTAFINNWDLVDLSAPQIVGGWLKDRSRAPLRRLAASELLWERRIAMLACFAFIKDGDSADALEIARLLLGDSHDLMHKAVGWMLRETGKRCSEKALTDFLRDNYARMPRTALRYAIERFPAARRARMLKGDLD